MAPENCLWGAPRIHGELLKLGIAISEHTVSRYLRGRPPTRSQTWRTFFANHLGDPTPTSKDLHAAAATTLDVTTEQYRLASLRYDLSKLRAKHLVEKVEHSRRYRLRPTGYRICVLFLKLFERVYAPLTAGLLRPVTRDAALAEEKQHRLDRLYQRIATDFDTRWRAVGLRSAA